MAVSTALVIVALFTLATVVVDEIVQRRRRTNRERERRARRTPSAARRGKGRAAVLEFRKPTARRRARVTG